MLTPIKPGRDKRKAILSQTFAILSLGPKKSEIARYSRTENDIIPIIPHDIPKISEYFGSPITLPH